MPELHPRMEGSRTGCSSCPFFQARKSMGIALVVAALLLLMRTMGTAHAAPMPHSPPTPLGTGVPVTLDEQALLSFKALIAGDPHGVLSSWNSGNGTSTKFEPHSSNLIGTISPFLANLTFLRTLNLSHNSFSGNIPPELGFLPCLLHLDLGHNSLQGMIPGSLASAPKLQKLRLEYNSLMGEIPANLSNLQELKALDLGSNRLSGVIPPSFGSLSKLTYLVLNLNNLSGGVPASLGNLSSLVVFLADTNGLSGQIPDTLGRLTKLKILDLVYNHISGAIPTNLFNISSITNFELSFNSALSGVLPFDIAVTLPNLEYLILNDCQLSGRIPQSIGNASLLRYIQLDYNELEGTVPLEVGNLKDLEVLTVSNSQLEDKWGSDWELIASLCNCSKLFYLALDSNNFQGVFPPSIVNLSNTMQNLYLDLNKLHGAIPLDICKLSNLTTLALGGNFLTGSMPPSIGELYNLGALDLSRNNISGKIPPTLGNLTDLFILYLFKNNLQGSIPTSLGKLQRIASLVLSVNQLTGSIPVEVVSLSSLTSYLGLSYNFLTGQIPSEVGKLMNLVLLYLSVNQLSGDIPATLGKCVELMQLQLNDNLLQGTIPQSLSGLQAMQKLDIAKNNLSGPVPKFFADWPSLNYLNLSYNSFEGYVPVTGVFSNASALSIAGNKACGGIPSLQLPQCPVKESVVGKRRPRRAVLIGIVVGSISLFLLLACGLLLFIMRQRKRVPNLPLVEDQHWQVSFKEIQKATDQFSSNNIIGMGSFGSVYRGILRPGARQVAIKVIDLQQHGAEHSFLAECRALRSIRHRNLVKVITACSSVDHQGNDFKALVYEFMPNGDLDKWLHFSHATQGAASASASRRGLTLSQRVNIMLDVAVALDYLHHHGQVPIVHCDLKPSNVLLDNDMVGHVADFGLARFVRKMVNNSTEESSTSIRIKGTIGYIPPEYGVDGNVSIQGDLYSYGVLLLEMFTGKRPTDMSFQGGQTLQSYVAACYPDRIMEIVDPALQPVDNRSLTDGGIPNYEINVEKLHECMVSILRVGLQCSQESSRARMDISSAIKELVAIKDVLLNLRIEF